MVGIGERSLTKIVFSCSVVINQNENGFNQESNPSASNENWNFQIILHTPPITIFPEYRMYNGV